MAIFGIKILTNLPTCLVKFDDDRVLWLAFKRGSESALEQLYGKYFRSLGSYGYRITPDLARVEDAIQDVFVELWRRREHLSEVSHVKFYLFRALRNQLIRNSRHDLFDDTEDIDTFLDQLSSLSSEQQLIDTESEIALTQSIQKALNHLSNRQREAVHLRFYQGMSLDESAELMGISKQVVKNLLSKAYTVLRLAIKATISLVLSFSFF